MQALLDELGLTRAQAAEALGVTVSRVAEGASTSPKMRERSRWSEPVWAKAQPLIKAYARKHWTAPPKQGTGHRSCRGGWPDG